jgi:hypothetical protein
MLSSRKRRFTLLAASATLIFCLSCAVAPKSPVASQATPPAESVKQPAVPEPAAPTVVTPEPPQEQKPEVFDPATVPEAVKTATFVDVRAFIESLNLIIRHKDYEAWRSNLTDDYIRHYSDTTVLSQYSNYPIIQRQGIKLQTLKDYFINVVYPSRQNDKVDDIEFVGENLVKAITVSPKGERNILYMLEKHGDAWKIGIGRS